MNEDPLFSTLRVVVDVRSRERFAAGSVGGRHPVVPPDEDHCFVVSQVGVFPLGHHQPYLSSASLSQAGVLPPAARIIRPRRQAV